MGKLRILDVGSSTSQGSRDYQEDRHICVMPDSFAPKVTDQLAYFAVYDGHGSDEASEFAKQSLHSRIADRDEFRERLFESAVVLGLKDIDDELYQRFKRGNDESAMCGCTVALCLVNLTEGSLLVANLGDSPVILGEKENEDGSEYKVERLSRAHKPTDQDEHDRIRDVGGTLNDQAGEARLGAVNMTRALGDLQLKRPLNEAHVGKSLQILAGQAPNRETEGDFMSRVPFMLAKKVFRSRKQILILASDGVTDALNDDGLVKFVCAMADDGYAAENIAKTITELVGRQTDSDNCTCIIALLGHDGDKEEESRG